MRWLTEWLTEAMTRTDYGTGSLYQRASDGRWMGTLESGFTASGARKRITVSAKTEAECKRKLRDKRNELDREGRPQRQAHHVGRAVVRDVAGDDPAHVPTIGLRDRPGSRAGHRRRDRLGQARRPHAGRRPRGRRSTYAASGKSTSTALRYHGSLIRMLKAASPRRLRDPAQRAAGREAHAGCPRPRRRCRSADTLPILAAVSPAMPDGSRWAMAFLQGVRQAEALGLTWEQVDLDAGMLTVSWQLKSLRYLDPADHSRGFQKPDGYEARHLVGATHLVRPKSAAGWRVIPLVPWATSALRTWHDSAPENPTGLVWPGNDRKGATWPRNAANDRDEWHGIQAACDVEHPSGRPYTVHEIRNTTATLLMELQRARVGADRHHGPLLDRRYPWLRVRRPGPGAARVGAGRRTPRADLAQRAHFGLGLGASDVAAHLERRLEFASEPHAEAAHRHRGRCRRDPQAEVSQLESLLDEHAVEECDRCRDPENPGTHHPNGDGYALIIHGAPSFQNRSACSFTPSVSRMLCPCADMEKESFGWNGQGPRRLSRAFAVPMPCLDPRWEAPACWPEVPGSRCPGATHRAP